jgi:hypothetical protein
MRIKKRREWDVFVDGLYEAERYKGYCYHDGRRWVWLRRDGGLEAFPPSATLYSDVRDQIARSCNVWGNAVEFQSLASTILRFLTM